MTNPNDPAFPVPKDSACLDDGLTKRELFAAMAMQAYRSIPNYRDTGPDYIAHWAVHDADALITELNKDEKADEQKDEEVAGCAHIDADYLAEFVVNERTTRGCNPNNKQG